MNEDTNKPNWLELAKIAQQGIFNRRELEWKLSLGFWSALAAFCWLFFTIDGLRVPPHFSCWLGVAYLILFAMTIYFWQLPLQKATGGDKRYYFYYLKAARGIIDPNFRDGKGTWKDVDHRWFFGHAVFTFFFLLLSWWIITQVAVPTAKAKAEEKRNATSQRSSETELRDKALKPTVNTPAT